MLLIPPRKSLDDLACPDGHDGGEGGAVHGVVDSHGAEVRHGRSLEDLGVVLALG